MTYNKKLNKPTRFSIYLPQPFIEILDLLVEKGVFYSRSHGIHLALQYFKHQEERLYSNLSFVRSCLK